MTQLALQPCHPLTSKTQNQPLSARIKKPALCISLKRELHSTGYLNLGRQLQLSSFGFFQFDELFFDCLGFVSQLVVFRTQQKSV